jgi:hypothetical protein
LITHDTARLMISDAADHGRLVLVFGAALSYYSGLPLFNALLDAVVASLGTGDPELAALGGPLVDRARREPLVPEMLFYILSRVVGSRSLGPVQVFDMGRPTYAHFAACKLAWERNSPILTTNFDRLIERAAAEFDQSIRLVKVHGSVEDPRSIRVAVDQVWRANLGRMRRLVGGCLDDATVLVAGYSGQDSDFLPVLLRAKHLVWAVRQATSLPGLPARAKQVSFVEGDIQDVLGDLVGDVPCDKSVTRDSLPWRGEIDNWAMTLSKTERQLILARLLAHVGLQAEAERCYRSLVDRSAATGDSEGEAAGHAGLVGVLGARAGNWDEARLHVDGYRLLPRRARSAYATGASVLINAAEAAAVSGSTFPWRKYVALAIPTRWPGKYEFSRYALGLRLLARNALARDRLFQAHLFLIVALGISRLLRDYVSVRSAQWLEAERLRRIGYYRRANQLLEGFAGSDARFAGTIASFWEEWERAELDRLRAEFSKALDRMKIYDPRTLNSSQAMWLHIQRAGCLRGLSAAPPEVDEELACAAELARTRVSVSASCYIALERGALRLSNGGVDEVFGGELSQLEKHARQVGLRIESAYLRLILMLGGRVPCRSWWRLAATAPTPWVRVAAEVFLSHNGRQSAARRLLRSILGWRARSCGMVAEGRWLSSVGSPSASDLQFP